MKISDITDITTSGIEDILKEMERYISQGRDDPVSVGLINYKINSLSAYTISEQVLALIMSNDMESAQIVYNHLKGKLVEIKEGFSEQPYTSLTGELEKMIIGPNSIIMQEAARRGGLK